MRSASTPAFRAETPGHDHYRGPLLSSESRTLIRILEHTEDEGHVDDNLRLLVFIPSAGSYEIGGWFHLFRMLPGRATSKGIQHIHTISCPRQMAGAELRDFGVHKTMLYALWDRTGQAVVEYTSFDYEVLDESEEGQEWHSATYPSEAELTPDYLDELLLRSGGDTLVDTFLSVILRPGVFSHFTIETALQQYVDSLSSIPGPPPDALKQSYLTLSEHIAAVVGCTVNLTDDPRTGVPQRDNYWNALKRDWEGFVARCRDIERSGRWPLALGIAEEGVMVLERERIGRIVMSDLPMEVRLTLQTEDAERLPFLRLAANVRKSLSNSNIHARESQFEIMVSQEHTYSYPESLDHCIMQTDDPREDLSETVLAQLSNYGDLTAEFMQALDIITASQVVKSEENDNSFPTPATRWTRGIATAYVNASTEARYDLCRDLILLLFQLNYRRHELPPPLISRIFVVFRNIWILRFLTWQPAGDPDGTTTVTDDQELAMLRGFQSMTVSRHSQGHGLQTLPVTYSLMHRLMDEDHLNGLEKSPHDMAASHISRLGLLASTDLAEVTLYEVSLCKWLFDLGFRDVALEIIGRLPRSVGITYVHGLVLVQIGRTEDGASMLRRVGAKFGECLW